MPTAPKTILEQGKKEGESAVLTVSGEERVDRCFQRSLMEGGGEKDLLELHHG